MNVTAEMLHQYQLAHESVALFPLPNRGIIEVTGADRAAWLHNLTTNVVTTLKAGEGNYAFAINVKGRVVVDLNILMLDDPANSNGRIWLDIDTGWLADALKHFGRYIISEDVKLTGLTPQLGRLALLGPRSPAIAARLGVGNLTAMASLQHLALSAAPVPRLVRHDFAGVLAAEFIIPAHESDAWHKKLLDLGRAENIQEIEPPLVEVLRIEAGIPASRRDIDADVVPSETGQIERGISYHKGCYLGQEVIERMRSHGVIPRRLVGIRLSSETAPATSLMLKRDGAEIGRTTSACWSIALNAPLALGYVKSAHAAPGTRLQATDAAGAAVDAEIVALPVTRKARHEP